MGERRKLLAIVEQGGYPNFTTLYQSCGFEVVMQFNMRKALNSLRKSLPDVIIAEFNHQSDFRDRTSSLESLLATVERLSHSAGQPVKVVVFYELLYQTQLEKLQSMFNNFEVMAYPIDEAQLRVRIGCNSDDGLSN